MFTENSPETNPKEKRHFAIVFVFILYFFRVVQSTEELLQFSTSLMTQDNQSQPLMGWCLIHKVRAKKNRC